MIDVKGLKKNYGGLQVLKGVDLTIDKGDCVVLVGPSGCGKSTFLRTLNRMNDLIPSVKIEGEVDFHGKNIYDARVDPTLLRKRIGMVFQKANPFPMSIYDNVAYGPRTHGIRGRKELDEIVDQMQILLSSANTVVVAAALATVGAMLEHYAVYAQRFHESREVLERRWRRLAGLLLKGLASYRQSVRQEALQILGERIFASQTLSYEEGCPLHPDGQEDPLPAGRAAGTGAELLLHRRRPLPHLPLHRLLSD